MNTLKKRRMSRMMMGIGFSLTIAFSGSALALPHSAHAAVSSSASVADNVIATGKQFIGVPYRFGAQAGITSAFDCSSFTQYVFQKNGIELPRSSREQAAVGTKVAKNQLQPGDLVFSDTNRDGTINHVSIYIGSGQLLHTYRVGIGVTVSDFAGSAWDETFVTARRVIAADSSTAPASNPSDNTATQPAGDQAPSDKQTTDKSPTRWEESRGWGFGGHHRNR